MQVFVPLQGRLQKLNFLLTLHLFALSVCARLLVAVSLVELRHFVDALLVLHLDAQLELELVEHARDLRWRVRRLSLDRSMSASREFPQLRPAGLKDR